MTTQNEALTLALEAFRKIQRINWNDILEGVDKPTDFAERQAAIFALGDAKICAIKAIEDIELTLAHPAVASEHSASHEEPVAFLTNKRQRITFEPNATGLSNMPMTIDWKIPLYGSPQPKEPEQEPVGYGWKDPFGDWYYSREKELDYITPLYTTPPQRTWVGLTDEEKSDIWCVVTNRDFVTEDTHVYADAIEAKLKEKNTHE